MRLHLHGRPNPTTEFAAACGLCDSDQDTSRDPITSAVGPRHREQADDLGFGVPDQADDSYFSPRTLYDLNFLFAEEGVSHTHCYATEIEV